MGDRAVPQEVVDLIIAGDAMVCYARCYPCQFGSHFDPPRWHSWADEDDIEHARKKGQPDPSKSQCGCSCAIVGSVDNETETGTA